ncbi:MAG: hypothetical protein O4861_01660 [Trichodesmium sp. St16_bin4-tuft]|nr:hypothetical protein [Trichodesmium sp. MAG_R01]MDE5068452.1 hypothetical protein [Trichodesmium sp. St4_bin8_1]MDE5074389.1 hypothetical protein [Trichodesmium sp. St5_bin8]MDE5078380.1 hypothetical protein [Trichodesmium sp. St2_bin6]MDE5091072.1 hypothetical protein [Trichodesmium sp. St18_bin3_1_1]MDE5097113.1 hypothetical protein [Trichodesmium sp. St16_bin4-tuft]MDE5102601.1 hypothetical protein [Trichodesmium sp. St19_bin2]
MRKIALEHQGLVADIQIYLPSLELAIDSTKNAVDNHCKVTYLIDEYL